MKEQSYFLGIWIAPEDAYLVLKLLERYPEVTLREQTDDDSSVIEMDISDEEVALYLYILFKSINAVEDVWREQEGQQIVEVLPTGETVTRADIVGKLYELRLRAESLHVRNGSGVSFGPSTLTRIFTFLEKNKEILFTKNGFFKEKFLTLLIENQTLSMFLDQMKIQGYTLKANNIDKSYLALREAILELLGTPSDSTQNY